MQRANQPPAPGSARGAWLLPPLFLGAAIAAFLFVRQGPTWIFGWVFGGLFAVVLGWIMTSILWPARADRSCPVCEAEAIERVDVRTTFGRRCRACGWQDETLSTWLLAEEEEDQLENLVLEQRRARRRARRVDNHAAAD
ncbi:MAG: hypothetical protein AAF682_08805 [Planctomycetota bacterium]